jgi:hypothetical protein
MHRGLDNASRAVETRERLALHTQATMEEEFVTLLEAHKNLVAVGKFAFNEETYENGDTLISLR